MNQIKHRHIGAEQDPLESNPNKKGRTEVLPLSRCTVSLTTSSVLRQAFEQQLAQQQE